MIMNAIKEYKELIELVVKTKEWNDVYLFPQENYGALKKEIRQESHVEVAPFTLVNKFDVSTRLIKIDKMTEQIMKHPRGVQNKLRKIIKEREQKKLEINWFGHVWKIYLSRMTK